MQPRKPRVPKLRAKRVRGHDYAVAKFNRAERSFGRWDDPNSVRAFHAYLSRWEANGRRPIREAGDSPKLVIRDLERLFLEHARIHYRHPDGTPTREARNFQDALRHLVETCGNESVETFDASRMEAVRDAMLEPTERCPSGLARNTVNARLRRLRQVFRWARRKRLVPPSVVAEVELVDPLPQGRSLARETAEVPPAPPAAVEAALPHVSNAVAAMIEIQRLTGMRPGEVIQMRLADITQRPVELPHVVRQMAEGDPVWTFSPPRHKNAWRQHTRTVYLLADVQEVLRPFVLRVPRPRLDQFLFSPCDASKRVSTDGKRAPRDRYTVGSYARAISRAVCAANAERARSAIAALLNSRGLLRPGKHIRIATSALTSERTSEWVPDLIRLERAIHQAVGHARVQDALKLARECLRDLPLIPHWSPNQLRHACGTRLRQGEGVDAAQVMLGHRSSASTERYARPDTATDWGYGDANTDQVGS